MAQSSAADDQQRQQYGHSPADVDAFLDEIACSCPSLQLTRRDVLYAYQGLIPSDVDDSRSGG